MTSETGLTPGIVDQSIKPQFSKVLSRQGHNIYLANHSLGRPPDATEHNVAKGISAWYQHMDACWEGDHWMAEIETFRTQIGQLLGFKDASCVIPKTSAGQGLRAVLNSFPQDRLINVVTTRGEFDSIDFILKTYELCCRTAVRWVEPRRSASVPTFEVADLIECVTDDTDLVVVSAVFFMTGQVMRGLETLIAHAQKCGCQVLIDTYHAAGVFPVDYAELDADYVIGGCYKYLRGGPGACYLAVNPKNFERRTLDTGWFAKADTFAYHRPNPPVFAPGGDGWLESTPPVLTSYQANPGIAFTLQTGVSNIRKYTLELQANLRDCLLSQGVPVIEPNDPDHFGAFVLVSSTETVHAVDAMKALGLSVDARSGFIRFGPDLLNSRDEIEAAAAIAKKCLS